ncbi:MAG: hypothetical protein ACLQDQ_04430 [Myxococcaceae bacterium]
MTPVDLQRLLELGLLRTPPAALKGPLSLLGLCATGALEGGLSVARDVRADELVGPLCSYLGGPAARLRVLDVRREPPELWVRVKGEEACWAIPDVAALVTQLNRCYREQSLVPAVARLGEWEGAWQLWCIRKQALAAVLAEAFLRAENSSELSALVGA